MSRADMESASPRRHTLQSAVLKPEELSALSGVGGTRLAMMVDQTRCRWRWGWVKRSAQKGSGRHDEALPALFFVQPGCLVKRRVVAQRGVADARELFGWPGRRSLRVRHSPQERG